MTGSPWAVVLAGGDGRRVSAMTRDADGRAVPKQFWSCGGRAPMVRWALARARCVAPGPRVLVVVNEDHRNYWDRQLADVPRHNIVVQPCNRGTAAGVLLALVEIQARGSAATPVVLLPSDHHVDNEAVLRQALLTAVQAARRDVRSAMLLGVKAIGAEPGYGWILPATQGAVARVRQFVEKPPPDAIREMLSRGALINSFIVVARVQAMLDVIERTLPDALHAFRRRTGGLAARIGLRQLYAQLPHLDLSRDVLERAARFLSVVRIPPCGWSDLGTPERLRQFLDRPPAGQPASPPAVCPATAA